MAPPRHPPAPGESDVNLSPLRRAWQQRHVGPAGRAMVEEDARLFLHQSVSSPCLTAIRRAEGIWIEDADGRRAMDFHGNSVHHIGYGHPRLKAAIARQMDDLPFAPRRFTNEPAIALARKLAAIAPAGLEKMLFTTGGSDAIEVALKLARAATGRFKTVSFWDSFHGAGFAAAAPARSARCCPAPSTSPPSPASAARTATAPRGLAPTSRAAAWPAPATCATCWNARATSPPSSPSRPAPPPPSPRQATGRRCAAPATRMARC
jgi:4-aminobutyrate aminotransferase